MFPDAGCWMLDAENFMDDLKKVINLHLFPSGDLYPGREN
jgi:hypothetical protein